MTKNLLVMRHAKSSWKNEGLTDHQRPLNKRGLSDAPRMAEYIGEQNLVPDLVLSSTAKRAQMTANLFVENCPGIECAVETTDEFYHAPARVYIQTVLLLPDSSDTAMFIGHNPGLEVLVEKLSGDYEVMSTAAIAWFVLNIRTWKDFDPKLAELNEVWRPKEI